MHGWSYMQVKYNSQRLLSTRTNKGQMRMMFLSQIKDSICLLKWGESISEARATNNIGQRASPYRPGLDGKNPAKQKRKKRI